MVNVMRTRRRRLPQLTKLTAYKTAADLTGLVSPISSGGVKLHCLTCTTLHWSHAVLTARCTHHDITPFIVTIHHTHTCLLA